MDRKCVIKIVPNQSFVDESVNITISGLQKRQKVTLRAVSQDYYCINAGMLEQGHNSVWESYGIFTSDDNGNISLKDTIPTEGTYQTNDAMGLFYSMRIKKLNQAQPPKKLSEVNENRCYHIHITAEVDGKVLASKTHLRQFCDETIKSETLMKDNLIARYFTSSLVQKRPTIIVVSGCEGRIEKAQAIAQVLAHHGYSSLAVCYFGLEGAAPDLNMISLDTMKEAILWLKRQDTVDDQCIGIYGRSKGGELALTVASLFHDFTCVIANTPSCYVYEGLKNGMPSRKSSWTYEDKEIPCLKFPFSILLKTMIKKLFHKKDLMEWMYRQVISKVETDEANIAVERICGPILFLSSASDAIWPSLYHCETAIKRLCDQSFPYPYKHFTYEKSGHMLTLPYQSIPNLKKCNGYLQEWEEACLDSWNQTIDFLDKWGKDSSSNEPIFK